MYVTIIVSVPTLLDESVAVTNITFVPMLNVRLNVQEVVPVAVLDPPPLLVHVTVDTATSSDAVPAIVIAALPVEYDAADVGVVMVHTGLVVSPPSNSFTFDT